MKLRVAEFYNSIAIFAEEPDMKKLKKENELKKYFIFFCTAKLLDQNLIHEYLK